MIECLRSCDVEIRRTVNSRDNEGDVWVSNRVSKVSYVWSSIFQIRWDISTVLSFTHDNFSGFKLQFAWTEETMEFRVAKLIYSNYLWRKFLAHKEHLLFCIWVNNHPESRYTENVLLHSICLSSHPLPSQFRQLSQMSRSAKLPQSTCVFILVRFRGLAIKPPRYILSPVVFHHLITTVINIIIGRHHPHRYQSVVAHRFLKACATQTLSSSWLSSSKTSGNIASTKKTHTFDCQSNKLINNYSLDEY